MSNKKIVVYFSYNCHTRIIAKRIAERLNCDILEVYPEVPYSSDYDLVVSQYQNNEHDREMPRLKKMNVDLNEYDEIIVGTPVWWYTITPPIRTFLNDNDFTGKKVIPFATNAGWIGRTFNEIRSLCEGAIVENEMNILFTEDHSENKLVTSEKEIDEWIDSL